MMARWDRWGPLSGLLLCITWAPMAIAIPRLPDLGSAHDVQAFWRTNQGLMQCVILSVSVGFLFLLVFLGAFAELVRTVHGAGAIAWIVLGSALMFMTALNVALGLDIAGGLLVEVDPASTYALHTGAFLLAAPAAFAGATFFVAIALIHLGIKSSPRVVGVGRRRWCDRQRRGCLGRSHSDGSAELGQRDRRWHCGAAGPLPAMGVHRQCVVASPCAAQLFRNSPIARAVCSGWSSMTST